MRWVPYAVPRPGGGGDRASTGGVGRRGPRSTPVGRGSSRRSRGRRHRRGRRRAGRGSTPTPGRSTRRRRRRRVMGEGEGVDPARLGEAGLQVPGAEVVDRRHSQVVGRLAATIVMSPEGRPSSNSSVADHLARARIATPRANQRAVRSDSVMLAHTSRIGAERAGEDEVRPSAVPNSRPVGMGVMRSPPRGVVGQRLLGPPAITAGAADLGAQRRAGRAPARCARGAQRDQPGLDRDQGAGVEPVTRSRPRRSSCTSPCSRRTRVAADGGPAHGDGGDGPGGAGPSRSISGSPGAPGQRSPARPPRRKA